LVVATGMNTEFGRIVGILGTAGPRATPLQQSLDKVGGILAVVGVLIVAAIASIGIYRGLPFVDMLIFGIALAVAVVPEALPAVVTISLAIGARRMVKRHALIRRLPAVETLGCTSVICSDKTGTLTRDEMTVRKIVAGDRVVEVSGAGYEPFGEFLHNGLTAAPDGPLQAFLQAGVLASDARIVRGEDGLWRVKGDPTEGALVVAAAKAGLDKTDLESRFPRVEEIPFASETKRMTTLHADWTAYSKGAVEVILRSCAFQLTAAGEVSLDENGRATILAHAQDMATDALRVLAVARKTGATLEDAEHNMTFLGLAGMIDPPRPESRAAIRICERAGIKVVMITGDHPLTAQAVARELGILKAGRVVTGAELEEMSTAELERRVESIEVYARVSPQHKLQIVTALQKQGHIVAMTGDGVNDAPALKRADIGVAMGITGTDVSREAAAMILTDDNFHSIVAAVEEGRGIYSNIKKYLMYLLSANIGEIGLIAATSLIGLPLPLSAVQILYVNLATDGLPALALAVDPADTNLMQRKPRDPKEGIFNLRVALLMLTGGTWSALVNTGLFVWVLQSGQPTNEAMTMTFVSLVLIEFFKAYCFRSEDWLWRRPFVNRWLNLAIVWELLLLSLILYVPFLQGLFGAHPLNQDEWTMVLGVAFSVVPVLEIAKWITRRLEARA
jgi:Ca2+-transporting ATPase